MRLGLSIGPNPCATQIESIYAATPAAFRSSPYGVTYMFDAVAPDLNIVPYLIDPATLEIEFRDDLKIALSNNLGLVATLDDSTMVWHEVTGTGPYTSDLRVLTRSGITIAMSGAQQSVSMSRSDASVIRLDSTHFLREYEDATTGDTVVQVFSVSGSTISLAASANYAAGPYTVTRDGGEAGTATLTIAARIAPFHWDGSATLYCSGFDQTGLLARIHAAPFTTGGSISAPGLSWRSRDGSNASPTFHGKEGGSECLLRRVVNEIMGFYDDGSQMHYLPSTLSTHLSAVLSNDTAGANAFGDYLSPAVLADPPGTPVSGTPPAIVSQSGTSLSWSPIDVAVRCYETTGLEIDGTTGPTRHDTALGAVSQTQGAGIYRLWAFKW